MSFLIDKLTVCNEKPDTFLVFCISFPMSNGWKMSSNSYLFLHLIAKLIRKQHSIYTRKLQQNQILCTLKFYTNNDLIILKYIKAIYFPRFSQLLGIFMLWRYFFFLFTHSYTYKHLRFPFMLPTTKDEKIALVRLLKFL